MKLWVCWLAVALAVLLMTLEHLQVKKERTCASPLEIPGFLDPAECASIRRAARRAGMRRSEVGTGDVSDIRTSTQVFLRKDHPAVVPVVEKAERILGIDRSHFEELQVVRYRVGQKYEAHFDSDDDDAPDALRVNTLLMYLNDVKNGGETEFPKVGKAGMTVRPAQGKAILWRNVDSRGDILPCAFHGGRPVGRGSKWIATVWSRMW